MAAAHHPHGPHDESRKDFEHAIVTMARRFDLKPLLDLLLAKGYKREEILFESVHEGESAGIIESVTFRKKPHPGVVIQVNLGLLGDNTLLPSYFFQEIEKHQDAEHFFEFIRFFDHRLIEDYRRALYPEDDRGVYRNYRGVLQSFFRMLGPASVSTLHWLAQIYFPELGVRAKRWAFSDSSDAHAFRTGESLLDGTGILGRKYVSDSPGLMLDLFAEEERNVRGEAWPNVVRQRLHERVLPLLAPFDFPLMVRLKVLFHDAWAHVDVPFAKEGRSYLGYERIKGEAEQGHTTVIYRGKTKDEERKREAKKKRDEEKKALEKKKKLEEERERQEELKGV
jgi:hypothetical protein